MAMPSPIWRRPTFFPATCSSRTFGVTRHGARRLYDYDELCLLTECNFRAMPAARTYEDELSDQPWFAVAENDIFPRGVSPFPVVPGAAA